MKNLLFLRFKTIFLSAGALVASLFLFTFTASAANLTVNSVDDLDLVDGNCTLREAILSANEDSAHDACVAGNGTDIIFFDASLNGQVITLKDELLLEEGIHILGNGRGQTIIDGDASNRIFHVNAPGDLVTFTKMTLQNASANQGAAVYAERANALSFGNLEMNSNVADDGGALYLEDGIQLIISNSSFTNNLANSDGGALYISSGEFLEIVLSQFTDNVGESGGAIYVDYAEELFVFQSSFSSNFSDFGGAPSTLRPPL